MAMFLAEIAFLLELALFAAGLVLWHRGREAAGGPVRAAAALLVVGAVLTALCTGYFSVRYHVQGGFDQAYPAAVAGPACPHHGKGMGMGMPGMGMMGEKGMGPGMGGTGMGPGGTSGEAPPPPGHEEHHPDTSP